MENQNKRWLGFGWLRPENTKVPWIIFAIFFVCGFINFYIGLFLGGFYKGIQTLVWVYIISSGILLINAGVTLFNLRASSFASLIFVLPSIYFWIGWVIEFPTDFFISLLLLSFSIVTLIVSIKIVLGKSFKSAAYNKNSKKWIRLSVAAIPVFLGVYYLGLIWGIRIPELSELDSGVLNQGVEKEEYLYSSIRRFHNVKKRYPKNLNELIPEFIEEVPEIGKINKVIFIYSPTGSNENKKGNLGFELKVIYKRMFFSGVLLSDQYLRHNKDGSISRGFSRRVLFIEKREERARQQELNEDSIINTARSNKNFSCSKKMAPIPGGIYKVGKPNIDSTTLLKKEIESFCIDRFEVTQEEFEKVFGYNPARHKGRQRPVEQVDWFEAKSYCKKMEKRLPTEWEWEVAARAGTTTQYYWGDEVEGNQANCVYCWDQVNKKTTPVGSFDPNPWGIYDTVGNVWEWTASWYSQKKKQKVLRGGSWNNPSFISEPSYRSSAKLPGIRDTHGFRCAQSPE